MVQREQRGITSALFVPYLQSLTLREVEDLARQPEDRWLQLFRRLTPVAAVSSIKAGGVPLPREVAAAVVALVEDNNKELEDADEEEFKKIILSLQVGGNCVRDCEAVCCVPVAT